MSDKLIQTAKAAEGAALASMILDRAEVDTVRGIVRPDDFGTPAHRLICEAVFALADERPAGQIDLVRLRDWLQSRGMLEAVGGVEYLVQVAESCPTSANAGFYARAVKEHAALRALAEIGQGVVRRALNPEGVSAETIRIEAVKDLSDVDSGLDKGPVTLETAIAGIDQGETLYTSSGFEVIDGSIHGLGRGQVVVVAGRPGMGKSALMGEMALRLARDGKRVLFFSLEMSPSDIAQRLVCTCATIPLSRAIRGALSLDEIAAFNDTKAVLSGLPIAFDCHSLTPARLKSTVLSAQRCGACDVVFIDYLGLLKADSAPKSKYEATTDISNAIKRLALDADIPIVLGCQLNRCNEQRHDKRPSLADLRDSGAIEQDADVVLMLHRPHYYDSKEPSELCECLITKNRRGSTGQVKLGFVPIYCGFYEPYLDREPYAVDLL